MLQRTGRCPNRSGGLRTGRYPLICRRDCQMYGTPTGFKTSGFKTSVSKRLKRQVYKTSALQTPGHQNVRSSKRPVAKKHPYIFFTCGWWNSTDSVAAMFAGKVMAVFYSLFQRVFCHKSP